MAHTYERLSRLSLSRQCRYRVAPRMGAVEGSCAARVCRRCAAWCAALAWSVLQIGTKYALAAHLDQGFLSRSRVKHHAYQFGLNIEAKVLLVKCRTVVAFKDPISLSS